MDNTTVIKAKLLQGDTMTDHKRNYDRVMSEFTEDVQLRLKDVFEYETNEACDFRSKVYANAANFYPVFDDALCGGRYKCTDCGWCEEDSHLNYCGGGGCKYIREKYDVWMSEDGELEWRHKPDHKLYHEMRRYETFDALLTEDVKNSICEDVLGEILKFI